MSNAIVHYRIVRRCVVGFVMGAFFGVAGVIADSAGDDGGGFCTCPLDDGTFKTVECDGALCEEDETASCCGVPDRSGAIVGCACTCVST